MSEPPQSPPSSFWQLISGVAHDLDLMLQDLFPDAIPSPLRDEYGFADNIALDHESFANHATLLEQFMRGSGPPDCPPEGEYRSSKSLFGGTPTSDSSPSPPPPAPPPRCPKPEYSSSSSALGAQCGMVSSSSVSSSVRDTSEEEEEGGSSCSSFAPCDIGLLERLIRTHPVWFLPGIGRAGAVHLLQGKDVGNFVVRQSSKPNTMALSVRLPPEKGPYVEHYLVETTGEGAQLRLEGSDNNFHAIPMLVAHYCQCCDELPVQLALPFSLAQAGSRQELSSLALLGQDFWLSSLVRSPSSAPPFPVVEAPPLHSTFKPNLNGHSPPTTLPIAENAAATTSPSSSGSPPPPVAPKFQGHPQPPPPPPPRSFTRNPPRPESSSPSDLSSPSSNNDRPDLPNLLVNISEQPRHDNSDRSESQNLPANVSESPGPANDGGGSGSQILLAERPEDDGRERSNLPANVGERSGPPEAKKAGSEAKKKVARVAHYKQSNISDLAYYKSNLSDKVSDYEDVWGTSFRPQVEGEAGSGFFDSAVGTQTLDPPTSPNHRDKFSSPFYSDPVDSVPDLPRRLFSHRFSDPNLQWPPGAHRKVDATLDEERLGSLSSSADDVHRNQSLSTQWVGELDRRMSSSKRDGQTRVSSHDLAKRSSVGNKKTKGGSSWPLDSSWEWLAHDDDSDSDEVDGTGVIGSAKFPLHVGFSDHLGDTTTVEDIITLSSPELALPSIAQLTQSNVMRVSEYDNLIERRTEDREEEGRRASELDDTATEFCEPWDSLRWDRLLRLVVPETDILEDEDTKERDFVLENNERNVAQKSDPASVGGFEDTESNSTVSAYSDATSEGLDDTSASTDYPTAERYRNKSFEERLEPLLAAQRIVALRSRSTSKVGENIRHYIFRLADERDNTFAKSIEHFIQCTKESTETKPVVVMRNIRQFMNGIKNYLLKHGEGRFENLLQEERSKLKSDEFLDIDAVVEDSLHKLVIKPLKAYIYQLFVNEYTRNGSLKLLSDNIKFARTKTPEELGVRPEFKLPEGTSLEVVNHFLSRLQQAYSPLKKLENLLAAISTIYNSVQQDKIAQGKENVSLGAGDFLPIFICVLVRCGLIAAEIEADYMWGLLHPSLMAREGGYYLTTLSSAVHVLKSLQACSPESDQSRVETFDDSPCGRPYGMDIGSPRSQIDCKTPSPEPRLACIADLQGFLKIMIPDELTGSIISKTLPIKPNMTTKEVAKLIAHKFNVTNPQDYCLFKLVNGEETMLGDGECPQVIKADLMAEGVNCLFTYKRQDAKFIWPIMKSP